MKKSIHVIEHTPIYDLEAFKQRQKKRKIHQLFKNVIDTFTFLCAVFMTFSILFIGDKLMTTLELQNAVFIQNDQIKTDSLKVSEILVNRIKMYCRRSKHWIVPQNLASEIFRPLIM